MEEADSYTCIAEFGCKFLPDFEVRAKDAAHVEDGNGEEVADDGISLFRIRFRLIRRGASLQSS